MKVLVTGGAGFIGSHVADALIAHGADVVSLDSLDPGVFHQAPGYLNPAVDYCFADLRYWDPDDRVRGVTAVVHLAALGGVGRASFEPGNVLTANAAGTARLVDIMRQWSGLERVILASSFSVYGSNYQYACPACGNKRDGERSRDDLDNHRFEVRCGHCGEDTRVLPLDEGVSPEPLEAYGASKYMQELCFRGFTACPVHILRQSSVYGPRLRLDDGEATIIAKIAGWIARGEQPRLFEDGHQIRDWVHVGDTVSAILALLESGGPSIVNVCTGTPVTLSAASGIIARAMSSTVRPIVVGGYRPGDMRHCLGDPGRLTTLLSRAPLSFDEGARLTFQTASSPPATTTGPA